MAAFASVRSRPAAVIGIAGFVGALIVFCVHLSLVEPPTDDSSGRAYVTLYDPPRTPMDTVLFTGDGQAWAALARDPTFSDPSVFRHGTAEHVYRAQRPLFPWVLWASSLGRAGLVPGVLAVWSCAGVGLLGYAAVRVLEVCGRVREQGWLVYLLPGTLMVPIYLGPEALALGAALLACVWWWQCPPRVWPAAGLLTAAALMRELLLVVPLLLALQAVLAGERRARVLAPLVVPFVAFGAWTLALVARFGVWPSEAKELGEVDRITAPFAGLVEAWPRFPTSRLVLVLLAGLLLVAALVRAPRSLLTWAALACAAISTVLGPSVWYLQFPRVMLPLYAFALLAVVAPTGDRSADASRLPWPPVRQGARVVALAAPKGGAADA